MTKGLFSRLGETIDNGAKTAKSFFDKAADIANDPVKLDAALESAKGTALKGIASVAGAVKDVAENPQILKDAAKGEFQRTKKDIDNLFGKKPPGGDGPAI